MTVCITHLKAMDGAVARLVIVRTFDAGSAEGHGVSR